MGTMMRHHPIRLRTGGRPRRQSQRGVIMIFTLIALALMLIAVGAMIKSTGTGTTVIGNLAFRRDLTNRAELAISTALAALNNKTGSLYTDAARSADNASLNYSGTRLASPAGGIGVPAVLVSDSAYKAAGYSCLDGKGNSLGTNCVAGSDGVLIRWVIDRQCVSGTSTFDTSACGFLQSSKDVNGSAQLANRKPTGAARGLFRISVRVTGPRSNEAYIQATAG